MRALRFDRYGPPDVLRIEDRPEPSPRAGQAKVRVHAVALNPIDWKVRAGDLRFIPTFQGPPRGLGLDFAGEIVGIGGGASERHPGERVFGSLTPFARDGALAEYVAIDYERLVPILPTSAFGDSSSAIDEMQAAALPIAGGTALHALVDQAHIAAGQRVLITGAAGGVGHLAVQIAKHAETYVVAVCRAGNMDFVRALGADEAIDYARDDFTQRSDRFDIVFDAACASSFSAARRVLTESGCYLNTAGTAKAGVSTLASGVAARLTSKQRAIVIAYRNQPTMWRRLMQLAQEGVIRAHIERTITLDLVADAQRAMETGHGRGKIVVSM